MKSMTDIECVNGGSVGVLHLLKSDRIVLAVEFKADFACVGMTADQVKQLRDVLDQFLKDVGHEA